MASYAKDKEKIVARLSRIEGQMRGLQRMVEEEKYCVDVLTQLSSVIAATQKVSMIVLEDHVRGCVTDAVAEGRGSDEGEVAIQELIEVVERFVKK